MFNNVVLDVFIGLIFVFLLYGLLATILQEIIARWFGLRARMLLKALRRMLEDDAGMMIESGKSKKAQKKFIHLKRFFTSIEKGSLLEKFYNHPTIKYLGEDKIFSKPSYLHAHNFSQTIIHLLRGEKYDGRNSNESELVNKALQENMLSINNETLRNLRHLFADARQDTYLFKNKLEDWYEETMERASGWYKKQTQLVLVIIGLAIAGIFNVDSIAISKILMKDKKAREQMVQMAISRQEQYGVMADSVRTIKVTKIENKKDSAGAETITVDSVVHSIPSDKYLEDTYHTLKEDATTVMGILGLNGIPDQKDSVACKKDLLWIDSLIANGNPGDITLKSLQATREKLLKECLADKKINSPYQKSLGLKLLGWLLTALAISLGAPFWFDLLNKFIKLRESGPRPANTSLQDKPAGTVTASNVIKGKDGNEIQG